MGLEVREPFGVVTRFSITDACFELGDTCDKLHDLVEMPLEGSRDVFMHEEFPSLGFDNNVIPNPFYHFHVSPICSLPSISSEYSLDVPNDNPMICDANVDLGYEDYIFSMLGGNIQDYVSLCYLRGYDPSIDTYCISWRTCLGK